MQKLIHKDIGVSQVFNFTDFVSLKRNYEFPHGGKVS